VVTVTPTVCVAVTLEVLVRITGLAVTVVGVSIQLHTVLTKELPWPRKLLHAESLAFCVVEIFAVVVWTVLGFLVVVHVVLDFVVVRWVVLDFRVVVEVVLGFFDVVCELELLTDVVVHDFVDVALELDFLVLDVHLSEVVVDACLAINSSRLNFFNPRVEVTVVVTTATLVSVEICVIVAVSVPPVTVTSEPVTVSVIGAAVILGGI
jgi:hypothetical protein